MATVRDFRELRVYQSAFEFACRIHRVSRCFPKEETYSPTGQVRRSSRSVCANIAEAWRKRRYPASFVSKVSDADAEAAEVTVWLDFALDSGFIDERLHDEARAVYNHINGQLTRMMDNPEQWVRLTKPATRRRTNRRQED